MNAPPKRRPMTVTEFLDWEERQDERYEFVHGEITAMVGATIRHAQIVGNLRMALAGRLRGTLCRVFSESTKIATASAVFYPDVFVTCARLADGDRVVTEPAVIIEVMSPSSEHHDRFVKNRAYRAIDSVAQYVIVAQNGLGVESVRRAAEGWLHETAEGIDGVLTLPSLGLEVPLAEVYADTDLLAEPAGEDGGA